MLHMSYPRISRKMTAMTLTIISGTIKIYLRILYLYLSYSGGSARLRAVQ